MTRKDLWITSKLWSNAHGRKNVAPALRKTLTDLGLEYVDLYMFHWPIALQPAAVLPGSAADFLPMSEAPLHETWAAMEAAAERAWFVIWESRTLGQEVRELLPHCRLKPEVNQVELHPSCNRRFVAFCARRASTSPPTRLSVPAIGPLSSRRPTLPCCSTTRSSDRSPKRTSAPPPRCCSPGTSSEGYRHPEVGHSRAIAREFRGRELTLTPTELERIAALDQAYRLIAGTFWAVAGTPWTLQTIWDEP